MGTSDPAFIRVRAKASCDGATTQGSSSAYRTKFAFDRDRFRCFWIWETFAAGPRPASSETSSSTCAIGRHSPELRFWGTLVGISGSLFLRCLCSGRGWGSSRPRTRRLTGFAPGGDRKEARHNVSYNRTGKMASMLIVVSSPIW